MISEAVRSSLIRQCETEGHRAIALALFELLEQFGELNATVNGIHAALEEIDITLDKSKGDTQS